MSSNPEVNRVVLALKGLTDKMAKRLTLRVTANLIEDTPVDTGWASSNWVPSIGVPFTSIAGSKDGSKVTLDRSPSERGKADVVANYTLDKGAIYISNNVPYIKFLNEGSSAQAPALFVEAAVERALKQVK